jgi:hypothetical protein
MTDATGRVENLLTMMLLCGLLSGIMDVVRLCPVYLLSSQGRRKTAIFVFLQVHLLNLK